MQESNAQAPNRSAWFRFLAPLIAAALGGGLAGYAVLPLGSYFGYPPEIEAEIYSVNGNVDFQEVKRLDRQILLKNTSLSACVAGMLVVGLLGFGAGIAGTRKGALVGLVQGLLLGAVGGAIGGLAGAATWQFLVDKGYLMEASTETSTHAAIANTVIWAIIGMASGTVACVRGRRINAIIAGMMGGAIAAWLFFLMAAFLLTSANLESPIPAAVDDTPWVIARLLWAIVPATLIGLFIARATAFHADPKALKDADPDFEES